MRQHQKDGVKWLWRRARRNQGGILGDEMGLGKTVQIIALCVGRFEGDNMTEPVLIIVPCTLQRQWVQEFAKWWPLINVKMVTSEKRLRPRQSTVYIIGYERYCTSVQYNQKNTDCSPINKSHFNIASELEH